MGKTINRLKIISFIIIMLELVLIGVFSAFYLINLFGFADIISGVHMLIGTASIVAVNIIFVWVVILKISHLRQQTDLRAAEIIGGDVQEAYNFAMVGLVITDDNDIVLWTNDLFKSRHIEIIDNNILSWQPELVKLKESGKKNEVCKLVINSRNYEVIFLSEAGLWIFKDTTEYETVERYNKEQAPVIGILNIDNYDELSHGEDDSNDTITKLKNIIYNYSREYGLLLRRFKDDTYFMLCNYQSLEKMKADNFSIVDKVREVSGRELTQVTISIGIAHDFPDVIKLNELASAALDIAMSRGGDQVVVSAYGSEMEFFGGKSEAQEKRNKVKVRVLADSLVQLINNSANVLTMGHKDMDMDAFGACLGIKAICNRLNKECRVVADLRNTEAKTRAAINSSFSKDELETLLVASKDVEDLIQPDTLLIVCDVHIPSMVMMPELLDKVNKIVVIDHHRRAEEYIDSPVFNHIDPAASSTSEIIAEFIRFASINPHVVVPAIYATIMLSGIFLDSGFYRNKNTGIRTFEASTILKEFGADNSLADDFLKDDFEEVTSVNRIVNNLRTHSYGVVYAVGDSNTIYERSTLAKAANECLSMKNIHAAFVMGKTGNKEIRISCRSDGTINVQILAEKLGGGGHFTSAAVTFEKDDLLEVENMLNAVLHQYLADAKADARSQRNLEVD